MYTTQKHLLSPIRDSGCGGFEQKSEPDSAIKGPIRRKCAILLVDDEPALLRAYERSLRGMGHEFKTAKDGVEALELFRKGGIDLVVSDVDMPNMNGLKLIGKARELDPNIKFIFLTGNDSKERTDALIAAGAFDILAKPFAHNDLKESVKFALSVGKVSAEPLTDDIAGTHSSDEKGPTGEKKHAIILVVDDDPDARDTMESCIGLMGHTPLGASDGSQGLEIIRSSQVDLVISDLQMPGMNGLEMLREIKKEKPGLKVVLQTGRGNQTEVVRELLEAGAEVVLCKPIDLKYLESTIAKLI